MGEPEIHHPQAGTGDRSHTAVAPGGVGIDLIEIARIERALERRPRLAGRLFTEREISYAGSRRRPGRHLAVRFAAKEAVVKALGLGPGTSLRQIEVVAGAPPAIELHDEVGRIAAERSLTVKISLSHESEVAAAVAIAEGT
jgi:holo-[acyl-carrier protein] synthase